MRVVLVFLLTLISATANAQEVDESKRRDNSEILAGTHKLRALAERVTTDAKVDGVFFLIAGGFNGSSKEKITVRFAWQSKDGTYIFSELPLEKVRVRLDETAELPTISFAWRAGACFRCDPQELLLNEVRYATITVKEKYWPMRIRLPMAEH